MSRIKRIALTTDFSDAARMAYSFAVKLARKLDCQITLLHFASKKAEAYSGVSDAEHNRAVMQKLKDETQRPEFAESKISMKWLERKVSKSLPKYIEQFGCGFVITAIRKRKGLEHYYLTDIGDEVLAASPVPVFVFAGWNDQDETRDFKMSVPFGCWEGINDTLPMIKFLHEQFRCEVRYLFIQPATSDQQSWYRRLFKSGDNKQPEAERRFSALQDTELAGMKTQLEFCHGIPTEQIAKNAHESGIDLIIIGGRAFKPRLAKRVILQADCSVLKIPINEFEEM